MTSRTDFTDEEWRRPGRAPFVAGMAISFADPGGPIEAVKETNAALRTVLQAAETGEHGPFVQAVAKDVAEQARHRHNPLADFKPRGADARQEIEDEMRAVNALLVEKATPEEADQFREWLKAAAQASAQAAKEGGFMGFKPERDSGGEQQILDKVGAI